MPQSPRQDRLQSRAVERSHDELSDRLAVARYKSTESDAARRVEIMEHGTAQDLGDLRAQYVRQAQEGVRAMIRHRADRGDFLAALTVETDFRIAWTSGEAPASVVWERPSDGR